MFVAQTFDINMLKPVNNLGFAFYCDNIVCCRKHNQIWLCLIKENLIKKKSTWTIWKLKENFKIENA